MRHGRRGNYSIMFVLTCAVMLSYTAFSVDGGRMKVAVIQAEQAAEAASIAALAAVRDGAGRFDAEAAGRSAARQIHLARLGRGNASTTGDDFDLTFTWGEWDWEEPIVDTVASRWEANNNVDQAVTVRARVADGGIQNIFGPAIGLITDAGEQDRRQGTTGSPTDGAGSSLESTAVGTSARSAFRHRDIVVAVDVSRYAEEEMPDIRVGLDAFIEQLEDNGVPGDRISLVAYAGDAFVYDLLDPGSLAVVGDLSGLGIDALGRRSADVVTMSEPAFPLVSVEEAAAEVASTFDGLTVCDIGSDVFWNTLRNIPPDNDAEFDRGFFGGVTDAWNYFVMSSGPLTLPSGYGPLSDFGGVRDPADLRNTDWTELDLHTSMVMLNAAAIAIVRERPDLAVNGTPYGDCALRCACENPGPGCTGGYRNPGTGVINPECLLPNEIYGPLAPLGVTPDEAVGYFSCLYNALGGAWNEVAQCAAWESLHLWYLGWDPRRQIARTSATGSPLACHDGNFFEGATPTERFIQDNPIANYQCLPMGTTDPVVLPDRSFFMAGSDPATALQRARDILNARPTTGEPTVILIPASRPRCGPNTEISDEGTLCGELVEISAGDEFEALLDEQDADVYTLAVIPDDEDPGEQMTTWFNGRGRYAQFIDTGALADAMQDIARDMRIQVVQ